VFGTARAAVTATRVLPLLVLTSTTALALFAITLDRTTSRGMESGAWRTTGADARLDVFSDSATPARQLATRIAAAPGVTHVATGEILSAVQAASGGTSTTPTLVVVDAAAFRQLLRSTPLPDAPDLARLGGGNPVPALVRSHDGGLYPGMTIHLSRANAAPIDLTAVGTAPEIDGIPDVIVLDASAISPFVPNTIWVTGPGAADAIGPAATGTHAVIRTGLLRERRSAPLIAGLVTLDWAAAVTLLALGVLGFALAAAASAPERWQTLARLRTLGLRAKDTRRVAATELLPPVVVAAIGGPLLALLMIRLTFGPLALRTLTGQTADPAAVIPWWIAGLEAGVLLATLAAVVVAESVLRRRRRLSDVLRVGDT
jgi:putative ABC transport system permease protein